MSHSLGTPNRSRRGRAPSLAVLPPSTDARLLAYIDELDLRFAEFLNRLIADRTHSAKTISWYRQVYDAGLRPYLAAGDATSREAFRARLFDSEPLVRSKSAGVKVFP